MRRRGTNGSKVTYKDSRTLSKLAVLDLHQANEGQAPKRRNKYHCKFRHCVGVCVCKIQKEIIYQEWELQFHLTNAFIQSDVRLRVNTQQARSSQDLKSQ